MATEGQLSNTVVLRVKRKRTEDPLDAFLVAHSIKRAHLSGESVDKDDDQPTTQSITVDKVYQLVGTVNEGEDAKKQDILKKLESSRKRHGHSAKSCLHNIAKIQEKVRKDKKRSHQEARFRVIGQHRSHINSEESHEGCGSTEHDSETEAEVQRLLSVYDVVRDEQTQTSESRKEAIKNAERSQADGVNTILCNSVRMIREKLTLSNTAAETEVDPASSDEYVYDFYYPTDNSSPMGDIVEVLPFNERLVFEDMEQEFNEIYDDEDDSNDEDNWRNDYPDEGQSDDSENKRYFGDYGFNSDEEYRRQAFDGAALSSGDEDFAYFGQRYGHGKVNTHVDSEVYHEDLSDTSSTGPVDT